MRISNRALRIQASGIRRVFDLASRLEDPFDFSIGQPDFQPPQEAQDAAIAAIRAGHSRYTVTEGLGPLNEAILDLVARRSGVPAEACMVTSGVAGGLALSFMTLLEEDERALIPDPYFVCYHNLLAMIARGAACYDTYPDFRITEQRLEAGLDDDVKVIVVNTPSNPTGRTLQPDELRAVASVARRHDLPVISDEIYDLFTYDGPCPSMRSYHDQTIHLGGFSKSLGMPGWRIGYAVGPAHVIDKMRTLQQFSYVCAPAPLQHGALAALSVDLSNHVRDYRHKRDLMVAGLAEAFDLVRPDGAFYAFPRVPGGISGCEFMELALAEQLLVVPGASFSRRDTHMRLSFAMPDERIQQGCQILTSLARRLQAEASGQD